MQVKGPKDEKTLVIRFFHFFYKQGISAGVRDFPKEFSIEGLMQCECAPASPLSPPLTLFLGFRLIEGKLIEGSNKQMITLSGPKLEVEGGRLSGAHQLRRSILAHSLTCIALGTAATLQLNGVTLSKRAVLLFAYFGIKTVRKSKSKYDPKSKAGASGDLPKRSSDKVCGVRFFMIIAFRGRVLMRR